MMLLSLNCKVSVPRQATISSQQNDRCSIDWKRDWNLYPSFFEAWFCLQKKPDFCNPNVTHKNIKPPMESRELKQLERDAGLEPHYIIRREIDFYLFRALYRRLGESRKSKNSKPLIAAIRTRNIVPGTPLP